LTDAGDETGDRGSGPNGVKAVVIRGTGSINLQMAFHRHLPVGGAKGHGFRYGHRLSSRPGKCGHFRTAGTTTVKPFLLGDIGGTNARFALLDRDSIGPVERTLTADAPDLVSAVGAFLSKHGGSRAIAGAAFAVAGPVQDGRCALTNNIWVVDQEALKRALGLANVVVVNDFVALAWSLPRLDAVDLVAVGGGSASAGRPALVFGPGTGLGVACLVPDGRRKIAIASEGGHATLPAANDRQESVIRLLRSRQGHVSIERILSGSGLVALYQAILTIDQVAAPDRDAAEITQRGLDGSCPASRAALDLFCAFLGGVAGDLALTFGATGGVHIAGGIVPRFAAHLAQTEFRRQFEAKGRFEAYLRAIPTRVIARPDAAMVGLAALLGHR
jgi:glucokinase